MKKLHITELRSRIDTLRAGLGLPAFSYITDPTLTAGTTLVKAQHVVDLRTALSQAFAAAGLTAPTFTDPNLAVGVTPVKAAHLNEIRVAASAAAGAEIYNSSSPNSVMNPAAIVMGGAITAATAGGSQPHVNLQPYQTLNYCIALSGVLPR